MQNTGKNNFRPTASLSEKRKTNCWVDWQEGGETFIGLLRPKCVKLKAKEKGNWVLGNKRRRETKKGYRKRWNTLKHKFLRRKRDSERKGLLSSLEWKMCAQFFSLQQSTCGRKISWCCCHTSLFCNFKLGVIKEKRFLPLSFCWWFSI